MTIQYDGSDFQGWQVQARGRTVQGDIEKALSVIYPKEKITLIGAGRTDSGVHAIGQVANIQLPDKLSASTLLKAVNGNLKKDVRIDMVEEVDKEFNARFSATSREYEYIICKKYNTIKRNYSANLKYQIDPKILIKCSESLIGEHNFSLFCKSKAEVTNKICIIYLAEWQERDDLLIFRIKASRFLHHMVRYLVGTMLVVARNHYTTSDFISLLNNESKGLRVVRAPAEGLFLKEVNYS